MSLRAEGRRPVIEESPSSRKTANPSTVMVAIRRLRARFACAALGMTAIACVHTITRYYLPDEHNPRFDADRATQVLDSYLQVQCPQRIANKKPQSGDARLTLLTDTSGSVMRAELVSSTGDDMLDGLFGTIAAQLKVDSLRATSNAAAERKLHVGFSCSDSAAVSTLELRRK